MRHIYIIGAFLSVCLLAGCGGNKKSAAEEERRIFQIDSVDVNTGVQRMQTMHIDQEIVCNEKKYRLKIDRVPADDLPVVKSEMGNFIDNRISVKILHENGTTLFCRSFVKSDFSAHLAADFLLHSVLEGLVFDDLKTIEDKRITLAASISYPMTDLYIPFTLVVLSDGTLSLTKDEDIGELTPFDE